MNIRPMPGKLVSSQTEHPPTQARFARAYFLPWGCSCPRPTGAALAQPRNTRAMPIDLRRRDDIAAAVAAYDSAHPSCAAAAQRRTAAGRHVPRRGRVPTKPGGHRWRRVQPKDASCDVAAPGRGRVPVQAAGARACPTPTACTCRRCGHEDAAARRCSAPAVPCRWTATPRPASAYARAWSARNRQPGQHKGPITRAFLDVLEALLWGFHNARTGVLLPELRGDRRQGRVRPQHRRRGAEGAGVGRRADLAEPASPASASAARDLFGHDGWRWRVIRTSNAYVFSDPKAAVSGGFPLSPKIGREH